MKKAFKIPLIILGVVVVLLLLVNFLAGPIAKNYAKRHGKEWTGRELNVEKVSVNVFTGKLKVKDLTLFEEDDTTPFVSFERFETKIKWRDLFNRRLLVNQATISGLNVNVEQNHDWFNFNSLRELFVSDSTKTESSGFDLILNEIHLDKGDIRYADLALGNEFLLRDISLQIPTLDFSDLKTDVGLDLSLADNATLHTDIRMSENGENYTINLKLNNIGINVLEPYLQQYYPVDLLEGLANLDLEAQGPTDHILDFDLTGTLALNDVAFQDTTGNPLGSVDSVFAQINHLRLNDKVLDLEQLYLSGLNTAYVISADSSSNFDLLLDGYVPRDTMVMEPVVDMISMENEEENAWKINIADLILNQSELKYEDNTLPEAFQYVISDISLTSKQFTLDGNNAIQLQASLNKVGKLNLNWHGCFNGLDNHNLTLMLSNVKVADFSPYIVQLFGFPVENGTLSFRSQNVITDGNLKGINKLQVASPKLGDKVKHLHPQYDKVPLKLGFYLLTDKNNNVSLDLPISGNLNDPAFSYRKALGKVFSNLLTKVAASPFRLMTDEDNNLKYIPFDPLQFDFSPEQYVMIDNVAATLQSRSDLSIVLEEQVQYEETVNQLCIMQLKRDYYLSIHPDLQPSDVDFLTHEKIRNIKLNDKGLCEYAVQYSKKKKLHSKKDVASVAYEVYRDKSETLLPMLMKRRNELLSDYLLNAKGLSPEQVSVSTIDESLMKTFAKPSRYEMHVFTYEEME
ncbi:MAG: DUF748 domain-containing protein [Bacteroidales bacterium]|nr:DUF748 domain-containing protein [Bacteroidales bacterium]